MNREGKQTILGKGSLLLGQMYTYYSWQGRKLEVLFTESQCEFLIISSECSCVPHDSTTGKPLPTSTSGYLKGVPHILPANLLFTQLEILLCIHLGITAISKDSDTYHMVVGVWFAQMLKYLWFRNNIATCKIKNPTPITTNWSKSLSQMGYGEFHWYMSWYEDVNHQILISPLRLRQNVYRVIPQ